MLFEKITLIDGNYEEKRDMYLETEGNRIVYIGTERPEGYTGETYDGRNKVALPGFYNIHCHIPDTLLRGYGEGLPLHRWLTEKMFPFEAKLTEEDVYWSSMLGACELIRSGAASFNDMFYKLEWIERAVRDSGLKANLSFGVSALPGLGSYREYAAYAETEALRRRLAEAGDDRVRADVGLHAEYTSHEGLMRDVADYAREAGLRVHLHLSETRKEHEECKTRHNGLTPAALFERVGLFDVPAIAAHCVWTTEEDWALMAEKGVSCIHNPVSNLKLGSGVAWIPAMKRAGVNIALGTDGVSSNNNHDMFEEMKFAAILHNGVTHDPLALLPRQVLAMATRDGARALGRRTGQIAPGYTADLILVDFDRPSLTPCHSVEDNLVYSARGSDVVMNMARGKIIYKDGTFFTLDLERIKAEVETYALPLLFGDGASLADRRN